MGEKIDIRKIFTTEKLEELLKQVPNDFEANMLLAEQYLQKKKYSQAIRPLNTLIPMMKKKIQQARSQRGTRITIKTMLLKNRYRIEEFEKMLRLQLEALAACHMELGDLDKALKIQRENLEIDDSDPNSWNMYGVLLSRMQDIDEAERAFLLSLANNPQHDQAWISLGIGYRAMSRVEDERRITTFLSSQKDIGTAFSLIVDLLYLKGEFDFIKRVFRNHFKKPMFNHESFNTLCNALIIQDSYSDAERILEKLVSNYPSVDSHRWQLSRVYALQNKKEESMKALGSIQKDHFQFAQMQALKSALEEGSDSTQTLKVFFQYFKGNYDSSMSTDSQGLNLRYLTEVQVKAGTTVGDLIHILVKGEIDKISPYIGLPSIHHTLSMIPEGGNVYCTSMPCMLNEINSDSVASFRPSYFESVISRNRREANLSDLSFTGDILLLEKKPLRTHPLNVTLISTYALESGLKMMIDEEKKGQTHFNLRPRGESSDPTTETKKKTPTSRDRFISELLNELDKQYL